MAFHATGKKIVDTYHAILLFCLFLGYLLAHLFGQWRAISWRPAFKRSIYEGVRIVNPLIVVSLLLGISLTLSAHYLLLGLRVHNQVMELVQTIIIRDVIPFPIGFVLCVACGLNLIDTQHYRLKHTPREVILKQVIPLLFGLNITALLLYSYVAISFLLGIFLTSYYFLEINTQVYWLRLNDSIQLKDIVDSLFKTIIYASIAALTTGYYYFDVAKRELTHRLAISRIITRGLFWLIVASVLLKL
jgi:ABC-type transporter Mla maintaining outer membrane lipid asymmetry permease subunit MlaE